jgi:rubrerythrin
MPESQEQILELYRRQELLLSEIYALFAVRFLKDASQWEKLAQDELEHAQWIDALADAVKQGEAVFAVDKVRVNGLQSVCNYLEGVLISTKAGGVDRKKAFSLAIDMEKSIIERNVFKKFSGDSEKVSAILRILEHKQQAHVLATQHYASLQR